MFYNAYAKSIITYGSLVYGAADKTNQSRIESVQRKILRAYELCFSENDKIPCKSTCCEQNQYCLRVFFNEVVSEVFKKMRSDSPLKLPVFEKLSKSNMTTRWNSKGVFAPIVSRTVVKKKSFTNSSTKAHNWLTEWNLTPPNLLNLNQEQLKKHLKLVNELCITDNKELYSLCFCA